jgi:hypothetical protein
MFIVSIDLAAAEFVVTGYCSNDPEMIRIHKEGLSPHEVTGSNMSGLPIELIQKENKYFEDQGINSPSQIQQCRQEKFPEILKAKWFPRISSIRQASKKAVHSGNYGIEYRTFALSNEMPENEAKAILHLYRNENFKRLPVWYKEIQQELRDNNRTLENCFGRKVRLLGAWKPDLFQKAYAFKGQSTVGDIMRQCVASVYNDNFPSEVLQQVHDSISFQVPETFCLTKIADYLKLVVYGKNYLRPDLHYSGHIFNIGCDVKINTNLGKSHAVPLRVTENIKETEENLKEGLSKLYGNKNM